MADPELPAASDPPAPAPPGPPDASAIQAKPPDGATPATTAVTAPAPAAAPPAEVRPPRKPSPERLARRVRVLDVLLIGLVLVLAFFLGSFAVENSDFWMHLATGRLISEGANTFGVDPFSYTTEGVTWVNHAWLFDWLLYGLYQLAGGAGVVVCRGLLLAALAETLLRIRRPEQSLWLPAACVALALLTISTRLPLQPVLLSLLFLGVTLYLLHRSTAEGATFALRGRRFSPLWLLPPLFALWVNLDGLFLLGPLAVALFLLGAAVQRLTASSADGVRAAASSGDARTLGLVLVVGLAACLLNPYTYRAFTLPVDLAYPLSDWLPDALVPLGATASRVNAEIPQTYFALSPFSEAYWWSPGTTLGIVVAPFTYFVLLLLSIVSFALLVLVRPQPAAEAHRFPVGLFLLWLVLALLSAANFRFVALFAVVGGPAVALNFQELARRRPAGELSWGQYNWALLGRAGTALACLVLLLLTWPGWLHAAPDNPRRSHRVYWEIYRDPSFAPAARRLDELLATGKLQRGFNVNPEVAFYFAWYAGREARTFFDPRFALPVQAAADYARVRRSLREAVSGGPKLGPGAGTLGELARVFRAYRINYVVLTDLNQGGEARVIANRLTFEPARWAPLYADGRTAIFGWRDPERPGNPFAGLELQPERVAFGRVPEALRAPAAGPVPPDGPPNLWEQYAFRQPPTPLATSEARAYLNDYLLHSPHNQRWQLPFFYANLLATYAGASAAGDLLTAQIPSTSMTQMSGANEFQAKLAWAIKANGVGPPALPLLSARAARRAVAENPADGPSWGQLADAYQTLWRDQEQLWQQLRDPRADPKVGLSPPGLLRRESLRHVQYVAALTRAVQLQPDDGYLHFLLAKFFDENNFPDAALEHAQRAKEHTGALRRRWREGKQAEALAQAIEDQERRLDEEVQRRREEYDRLSVADRTLPAKLQTALYKPTRVTRKGGPQQVPRGLVKLAMKLMADTDPGALPPEQGAMIAQQQIHIMLLLGHTRELRETVFNADGKERLRRVLGPAYDAYEALYDAAVGDYAAADKALAAFARQLPVEKILPAFPELEKRRKAVQEVRFAAPVFALLSPSPGSFVKMVQALQAADRKAEAINQEYLQLADLVARAAELGALRGLLALEQGATRQAFEHLRASLRLVQRRTGFPSLPTVQRYERLLSKYWGQAGK